MFRGVRENGTDWNYNNTQGEGSTTASLAAAGGGSLCWLLVPRPHQQLVDRSRVRLASVAWLESRYFVTPTMRNLCDWNLQDSQVQPILGCRGVQLRGLSSRQPIFSSPTRSFVLGGGCCLAVSAKESKQEKMKFGEHLKSNIEPTFGPEPYLNYERLDRIISELSQTAPSR